MQMLFFGRQTDAAQRLSRMLKSRGHTVRSADNEGDFKRSLMHVTAIIFCTHDELIERILFLIDRSHKLVFLGFAREQIQSLRDQGLLSEDVDHCWFDPRNLSSPEILEWVADFLTGICPSTANRGYL